MQDPKFLKTAALISRGKLRNCSLRWKTGTEFTIEQIATLYRIERRRAMKAARLAVMTILALMLTLWVVTPWIIVSSWTYFVPTEDKVIIAVFQGATGALLALLSPLLIKPLIRDISRLIYRALLSRSIPAGYAKQLKTFADAFNLVCTELAKPLWYVVSLSREEIVAKAISMLEAHACLTIQFEREMQAGTDGDEVYTHLDEMVSIKRQTFREGHAAFSQMGLITGGYSNFYRRAAEKLDQQAA